MPCLRTADGQTDQGRNLIGIMGQDIAREADMAVHKGPDTDPRSAEQDRHSDPVRPFGFVDRGSGIGRPLPLHPQPGEDAEIGIMGASRPRSLQRPVRNRLQRIRVRRVLDQRLGSLRPRP